MFYYYLDPNPVVNVTVSDRTNDSLSIEWGKPADVVTQYRVLVKYQWKQQTTLFLYVRLYRWLLSRIIAGNTFMHKR